MIVLDNLGLRFFSRVVFVDRFGVPLRFLVVSRRYLRPLMNLVLRLHSRIARCWSSIGDVGPIGFHARGESVLYLRWCGDGWYLSTADDGHSRWFAFVRWLGFRHFFCPFLHYSALLRLGFQRWYPSFLYPLPIYWAFDDFWIYIFIDVNFVLIGTLFYMIWFYWTHDFDFFPFLDLNSLWLDLIGFFSDVDLPALDLADCF